MRIVTVEPPGSGGHGERNAERGEFRTVPPDPAADNHDGGIWQRITGVDDRDGLEAVPAHLAGVSAHLVTGWMLTHGRSLPSLSASRRWPVAVSSSRR